MSRSAAYPGSPSSSADFNGGRTAAESRPNAVRAGAVRKARRVEEQHVRLGRAEPAGDPVDEQMHGGRVRGLDPVGGREQPLEPHVPGPQHYGQREWESLDDVAEDAYEEAVDGDLEKELLERGHDARLTPGPLDDEWDFEDDAERESRYPRLSRMFQPS